MQSRHQALRAYCPNIYNVNFMILKNRNKMTNLDHQGNLLRGIDIWSGADRSVVQGTKDNNLPTSDITYDIAIMKVVLSKKMILF
jgi:hypothetical protein